MGLWAKLSFFYQLPPTETLGEEHCMPLSFPSGNSSLCSWGGGLAGISILIFQGSVSWDGEPILRGAEGKQEFITFPFPPQ